MQRTSIWPSGLELAATKLIELLPVYVIDAPRLELLVDVAENAVPLLHLVPSPGSSGRRSAKLLTAIRLPYSHLLVLLPELRTGQWTARAAPLVDCD